MPVLLLGPIWLRGTPVTAPPEDVTVTAIDAALPARHGDFTRAGVWQLASPSMDFGGYSALLPLGDRFLRLFSDRGTRLTLAVEDGVLRHPGDRRVFAQVWDVGHFGNVRRDSESATRDPESGDYWLGFESFNAIVRYDVASNRLAARRPPEMARWPVNGGAEAMVRLADGRFIVLPEHRGQDGGGDGLLFPADPTQDVAAERFRFTLPDPYYATAAAQMPDGRVLVLARGLRLGLPPFTARLYAGDPARIAPGGEWKLEKLLDLDTILPRENYEALGVSEQDDGTAVIWIASDDNQAALQRTLVARLIWRPAQQAPRKRAPGQSAGRPFLKPKRGRAYAAAIAFFSSRFTFSALVDSFSSLVLSSQLSSPPLCSTERRPWVDTRNLKLRSSFSEISVTFCRLGRKTRLVLLLAWLTLWPTWRPLPVSSQMRDMTKLSRSKR